MRLSKRMGNILETLQEKKESVLDKDNLKELLKEQEKIIIKAIGRAGRNYDGPLRGDGITDEYVEKEQRKRSSMTQKELIVTFEVDYDPDAFSRSEVDMMDYTESWVSRFTISLPEYIAGHYWPKGRMWANNVYADNFKGYEEAKKKANSLNASYSRTLKKMVELDLVEETEAGYMITEKGEETIDKC